MTNPLDTNAPASGSRLLPDPTVGLSGLKNYHVSFRQDVIGTLNGKHVEHHLIIELTHASGLIDFTHQIQRTDEPDYYARVISQEGAVYRWHAADQNCQGTAGSLTNGDMIEPASLLLPVQQASNVGSETVDQIRAVHYHFDQNSLSLEDPKPILSGDLWLAEQGGYVVKFTVNTVQPSEPDPQGNQTSQSWSYELNQRDADQMVVLPEGCTPVLTDIPALPDALNVSRFNVILTYNTTSQALEVIDLYHDYLTPKGWSARMDKPTSDVKLPYTLSYIKGAEEISVFIDNAKSGERVVTVLLYNSTVDRPTDEPGKTPELTSTQTVVPEETTSPSLSGLPVDIPLYPGATSLLRIDSVIQFKITDSQDVVAKFYHDQMIANEWNLTSEDNASSMVVQVWNKPGRTIGLTITTSDGKTIVTVSIMTE
jgi:hypothetical protein